MIPQNKKSSLGSIRTQILWYFKQNLILLHNTHATHCRALVYTLHFLGNLQKFLIIPQQSVFFLIGLFFTIKNPHLPIFAEKKIFFCAKKISRLFRARSKISENFPRAKSRKTDASWEFWSAPWTPNDARWNFTPRSKILSARSKIFKARRSAQHAPQTRRFISADHFRKSSFHYNCFIMDHGSGLEREPAPVGRLLFGPRRGLGATCSTKAAQRARKGCVTCGFGAPRGAEASPM